MLIAKIGVVIGVVTINEKISTYNFFLFSPGNPIIFLLSLKLDF